MPTDFTQAQQIAVKAVRQAAVLCQQTQAQITPDVLEKKDRSPVTIADFGSQAIICHALNQAFPDDPIIAEEDSAALTESANAELLKRTIEKVNQQFPSATAQDICQWIDFGQAKDYSDRFWTLDPIDGTKGFLRSEQYAISLALIIKGEIHICILGCPNLAIDPAKPNNIGALFTSIKGCGAYVMPLDGKTEPKPIKVTDTAKTSDARFCESVESGHSSHSDAASVASLLNITSEPVRLDSQAKYATVARGQADIYMRLPTRKDYIEKIWDHAGGVGVITEAGGKVTDISGKPLDFTHGFGLKTNRGVLATNGKLHDHVLAALQEVGVK